MPLIGLAVRWWWDAREGSVSQVSGKKIFLYTGSVMAIAMWTAVPIDLYCYADIDYTVIAVCCNVLYKTHLIAYDGY